MFRLRRFTFIIIWLKRVICFLQIKLSWFNNLKNFILNIFYNYNYLYIQKKICANHSEGFHSQMIVLAKSLHFSPFSDQSKVVIAVNLYLDFQTKQELFRTQTDFPSWLNKHLPLAPEIHYSQIFEQNRTPTDERNRNWYANILIYQAHVPVLFLKKNSIVRHEFSSYTVTIFKKKDYILLRF